MVETSTEDDRDGGRSVGEQKRKRNIALLDEAPVVLLLLADEFR